MYKYKCQCCGALYVGQTRRHIHTRISEHMGVSSKTGNKLSVSQMSAVLTHHHLSGHNISDSDFTILTSASSGNSKFDLEMRESLFISKLKPSYPNLIPEPAVQSAATGVSPERRLLILRCESHPPICVGLVWFGRSTF